MTQQTCLLCDAADMPPGLRHKTMVFRRDTGGASPPMPMAQYKLQHIQALHNAKPSFCVAGREGHAPPCLRRKTTVLRRSWGRGKGSMPKRWILTPTPPQKLSFWTESAKSDQIKRFRRSGSKMDGSGPKFQLKVKYAPRPAKTNVSCP